MYAVVVMHYRAWLLLGLSACAGGSAAGEPDAGNGPGPVIDASGSVADADTTTPVSCLEEVPVDYGSPTPVDNSYSSYADSDEPSYTHHTYYADLVPDSQRMQRLFVALHPQATVFPADVEPGTYNLQGDDTDYAWCGACVYLAVDDDGSAPSVLYMAQKGTLKIDSVSGGEIHGELIGADLMQIAIEYEGASCPGGDKWPCGNTGCVSGMCGVQNDVPSCTTHIESLSF